MNDTTHIARQTARGSAYTIAASGVTITLGFVRSVLLARFLLPEDFGTFALAMVFIVLGNRLRSLGLPNAILHKQTDEGPYYTTFITLHSLFVLATALLYAALAPLVAAFYPDRESLAPVMVALVVITAVGAMNQIQETLLRLHLRFDRLAATNVASAIAMFIVAPYLAWKGWGVWSLVAQEGSGILARAVLVWGPWRSGRLSLGIDRDAARWLLRFGSANWLSANTNYVLERFDDFWVGTALGNAALGFYNRAYEFARYPRRLIATSLVTVMTPVFARLQHDRVRLSKAFFRVMSLLVRVGLLVGGLVMLLTPEFVHHLLGAKWDPMIPTLQLMTIYMVMDPLVIVANNLLYALGYPEEVARVKLVQLAFFIPAVVLGARWWGINGVALAADAMLVVGIVLLYRPTRREVTYSLWRMAGWPFVALVLALMTVGVVLGSSSFATPQPLLTTLWKGVIFTGIFGAVQALAEGREVAEMVRAFYTALRGRGERATTGLGELE